MEIRGGITWEKQRFLTDATSTARARGICSAKSSYYSTYFSFIWGFPGGSDGKGSARNVRDPGSIPGLGKSHVEGNGNPLQYSCLENPVTGGGTWQAIVHGVTKVHGVAYYSPHFFFIFRSFLFASGLFYFAGCQVSW